MQRGFTPLEKNRPKAAEATPSAGRSPTGFTLVEIIVVIGIFSLLVVLGLFMSFETLRGTLYRSEEATIVSLLEKARSRAMNNINESAWGMCYIEPDYVIIKGVVCDDAYVLDRVAANPAVVAASSFISKTYPFVVFSQLSGIPVGTPQPIIVIQDARSSTISVNNEGTILW